MVWRRSVQRGVALNVAPEAAAAAAAAIVAIVATFHLELTSLQQLLLLMASVMNSSG